MDSKWTIEEIYTKAKSYFSEEFSQLSSNEDKVSFVYNILEMNKLLPPIVAMEKTAEASVSYRNMGSDLLHKNKELLYESLQLYNLALLYAPNGSLCAALAMANRSAVLFYMRIYRDSLVDVNTVLGMSLVLPEHVFRKLNERRKLCEEMISGEVLNSKDRILASKEHWNKSMKVKHISDKVPCASSSVDVKWTQEMGRHVVASKDIKVGEVIAVENPCVAFLYKSQYLVRCHYCMNLCNNLMACDNCCYAMFCSSLCKEKAWVEYHKVECRLMATLVKMRFGFELHALRIVIKGKNECGNWNEFLNKINDANSLIKRGFKSFVYGIKYFNSLHMMLSNADLRSLTDIFKRSVASAVLLNLLVTETQFFTMESREFSKNVIVRLTGGLLLHHIMTSATNMHCLSPMVESDDGYCMEDIRVGTAFYSFLSLLNHSCAPNVLRIHRGKEMALIALRPIKKNMQLLDNYGFTYETMPVKNRRAKILHHYKFICNCKACEEDWPLSQMMKPADNLTKSLKKLLESQILDESSCTSLQKGDVNVAIKKCKQLRKVLTEMDSTWPCFEANFNQEWFRHCLRILGEVVPKCFNRLYKWY